MSKTYAYVRVSTSEKATKITKKDNAYEKKVKQDYERQMYILNHSGIEFAKVFEEHVSGGVRGDQRARFNEMLQELKEGDTVVFTETSRFGRDYKDNFDIIDILTLESLVNVKFISNNISLQGGKKLNPYEWLTLSNCFIIDEFQKRLISFNTTNKLCALKEKGVKLGRKEKANKTQKNKILSLYKKGVSQNQISKQLNMSRTAVARAIKQGA